VNGTATTGERTTPMVSNATETNAAAANEYRRNLGSDYSLASELADYEAEQEVEDERWEREGRREMYEMLGMGEV
jgi:hypothetical protein